VTKSAIDLDAERSSHLSVVSALVDPFTAIHAYSGILPVSSLKLSEWIVQQALTKMTAFFRMGPLLLTTDVPEYVDAAKLTIQNQDEVLPGSAVAIPAVGTGQWGWYDHFDTPHVLDSH
jgi:hypothetical protein